MRGQHLDRDVAVEQLVVRLPDARHPAVGDMAHDAIAIGQRDPSSRDRRHPLNGTHRAVLYSPPAWPGYVIHAASAQLLGRAARTQWSLRSDGSTRTSRR